VNELAVGLSLAVAASVALNSSYLLQHRGAVSAPAVDPRRPWQTLRGLFGSRLWALGAVVGMTGWALHVAALTHAPLSLVQAFVAGGLGLMAPIASRVLREPLERMDRIAIVAAVGGLILLCIGLRNPSVHAHLRPVRLGIFLAISVAIAVGLTGIDTAWRARALGLAAGLMYGAADVAIKGITGVASSHGLVHALLSPWLLAAALATAAAFFSFQRALQTGEAVPVIVLMTAATTVDSVLGGFVVFGDQLGGTAVVAGLHVFAFALVAVASAALAPAVSRPREVARG
jgi:hypothetical protein